MEFHMTLSCRAHPKLMSLPLAFPQSHNLRVLLDLYDQWMDGLMPSMCLDDVVETIEKLGHKAAVRVGAILLWVLKGHPNLLAVLASGVCGSSED